MIVHCESVLHLPRIYPALITATASQAGCVIVQSFFHCSYEYRVMLMAAFSYLLETVQLVCTIPFLM